MGAEVLRHLSNFCILPEKGFVAGQSVCSAILDLYFNKSGQVYNDIDVFYDSKNAPSVHNLLAPLSYKKITTTVNHTQSVYAQNVYGHIYVPNYHRYNVVNSQSMGMLNLVECSFSDLQGAVRPMSDIECLIDSFDFNCVQVAVDLETKELFWTKEFADFIKSRQLKIVRLHTPFHSAIRLFKKAAELKNVFIDIPQQMQLVSWAANLFDSQEPRRVWTKSIEPRFVKTLWTDARWRFGKKMRDMYLQYSDKISPYFSLEEEGRLFTLKAKQSEEVSQDFNRFMQTFQDNAKQASIFANIFNYGKASEKEFVSELFTGNNRTFFFAHCIEIQGKDFLPKKQVSIKSLESVKKLVVVNHRIYPNFLTYSSEELLLATSNVKKMAKEFGTWIYGELENDLVTVDLKNQESVREFFKNKEPDLQKPLKNRVTPTLKILSCTIKELNTGQELLQEGQDLQHCVGGYQKYLEHSNTRIFSIITPQGRTTLEVSQYGNKHGIAQHRGFKNKNPYDLNEKFADWCVAYLDACVDRPLDLSWFSPVVLAKLSKNVILHTKLGSKTRIKLRQLKLKLISLKSSHNGKSSMTLPRVADFDEDIPF